MRPQRKYIVWLNYVVLFCVGFFKHINLMV